MNYYEYKLNGLASDTTWYRIIPFNLIRSIDYRRNAKQDVILVEIYIDSTETCAFTLNDIQAEIFYSAYIQWLTHQQ
jgi:hypothetical protein